MSLASDLVKKLLDPTEKFRIPAVCQYYKGFDFREKNLKFENISSVLAAQNGFNGFTNIFSRLHWTNILNFKVFFMEVKSLVMLAH